LDHKNIRLRKATAADIPLLRYWDQQPHVNKSDPDDDWHWEEELGREVAWREQLIAESNGRPIGFIQIINAAEEESHYWGDISPDIKAIDIWIGEADDLGKGYGTIMMQMAIARCFADHPTNSILIDPLQSNTRAHHFYEKIGFIFLRNQVFVEDHCRVYELTRSRWQQLS
jgi:aminoglycoside 6'-N-acetyltransferase